jgi:hypothetical protein
VYSRGRWVAGWLLIVLAGALGLATVVALIVHLAEKLTSENLIGGAISATLAVGCGLIGRHFLRASALTARHHHQHRMASLAMAWGCVAISAVFLVGTVALVISWATTGKLSDPAGLAYPAGSSISFASLACLMFARSRRAPDAYQETLQAPGKIWYREACSDVNPVLIAAAAALFACGVWLIIAYGSNGDGPRGFLIMVPVVPGLWLGLLVQYLPYGIVLAENYVQVGVRGVPPAGRIWLRARVPLDAVVHWDVMGSRTFRTRKQTYRPVPGKPIGAMHSLIMGARRVLWIQADPRRVEEYFPEYIMVSGYYSTSAEAVGYTQNGIITIGTRRPRALERALAAALPDRRLVTPDPSTGPGHARHARGNPRI